MNIFEKRAVSEDGLEKRFIAKVLQEEAKEITAEQDKIFSRFNNSDWKNNRSFEVKGTTLEEKHLPKHRFVDMKTLETRAGKIKKRNYPVHNKIMYGHANNIVRGISFGFTEQVKAEMKKQDGQVL
ncbi:hypothetical protein [Leeuwenhoekiella marinoflava]|uniref:Uncharacterized protein n=2 Tax=Leeuwenhoekiella marinoflava TaxID=988 RepID=A0A4Q0PNQ7_9FLAO|nr:hypothetical protein [Leeuwenhoekiella marinoflava]RXG32064.1 hypothetical protein DSL99_1369 [Leeuwenhoekiella marinoflava]SHE96726.1 hypothetical protein SAMN02745246_01424 [Leeuwenhoekiella marinoflava DSM 3653]